MSSCLDPGDLQGALCGDMGGAEPGFDHDILDHGQASQTIVSQSHILLPGSPRNLRPSAHR